MKVLFIGMSAKAGSAIMRGKQMASMRPNWHYKLKPSRADMQGYDVIVLVKKVSPQLLDDIRSTGAKFVYDPLDFWGQEIHMTEESAIKRALEHFTKVDADVVIATHAKFAIDIEPFCKRVVIIPHHYDPFVEGRGGHISFKNLIYFGDERYINGWYRRIIMACGSWIFVMSDKAYYMLPSAMIAARDGKYNSWINRNWKSGVKLATAEGMGVPFIHDNEAAYTEFSTDDCYLFLNEDDIRSALNSLKPAKVNKRFSINNMAKIYENMFSSTTK